MARRKSRFDQLWFGWTIGTLIPLIIFLITYQLKYSEMSLTLFIESMWRMKIFLKLLSVCVFPNLGFFLIFYRLKHDNAARGVILATFMFAFFVLAGKLI